MPEHPKLENCPDCNVEPGQIHREGCDIERCPECGGQYLSCYEHEDCKLPQIPWSGLWPGVAECRELGWYAKRNHGGVGYIPCDEDDPEATEDLNRLYVEAAWDKHQGKFVPKCQDIQEAAAKLATDFFGGKNTDKD